MKALAWLWNGWVNLVDKLPKPEHVALNRGTLRWNLEARAPGGYREGARLQLSNRQCMELLAILNELEGK